MLNYLHKTVTVFGATGHYGSHITTNLLAKNISVRILTRNSDNAGKFKTGNLTVIQGHVSDKEKVREALTGSDAFIVSLSAMQWGQIRKMQEIEVGGLKTIMDEAMKLGIRRMIFLSVYDIDNKTVEEQDSHALADTKQASEIMIKKSGFNWTILGCPPSYELFFRLLRKNRLPVPGGGLKPLVCISAKDVGEIAAQAISRDDLGGKRFRLAGPDTMSFPVFAGKVSFITGSRIKHYTIPLAVVNIITGILSIFNPLPRVIYKALKLMNNFPESIALQSVKDHDILIHTFNYRPSTVENEIRIRLLQQSPGEPGR